jgi:hypothetical protein
MKSVKSLLLSTTIAAATATGATLGAAPAQAMGLNGSISFTGTPVFGNPGEVNPESTSFSVNNAQVTWSIGDFANGNFTSPAPVFSTLDLTRIDSTINGNKADYSYGATTPFIDFGEQDLGGGSKRLTFNLNAGQLTRGTSGTVMSYAFDTNLSGTFKYGGSSIATGFFSGSRVFNSTSFQMTLEAKPVPEPLTILGSSVALGFGVMFKKRSANRDKK